MKVLHICNDFCGSKVHANLYHELDLYGIEQTIYTYFSNKDLCGKHRFEAQNTIFVYRPIKRAIHRIFYHKKIHDIYGDLIEQIPTSLESFNLIHAATLFSDGALAYRLYCDYGIPYIVAVRNTDIYTFLRHLPHTWAMGLKILRHAKRIVFISTALQEAFSRHVFIRSILSEIEEKFILQPNGIDSYWLEHVKTNPSASNHKIIYVGRFDRNKNALKLCHAILQLKNNFPDIQLHLVGEGGSQFAKIKKMAELYTETIIYHGPVYNKDILRQLYSCCSIFAMPSHHETFGLVYLEALSQHLAIVYTKGQAVDGLLDASVGESVNASSVESIKKAIKKIFNNREHYYAYEVIDFIKFDWSNIAYQYIGIYYQIYTNKSK